MLAADLRIKYYQLVSCYYMKPLIILDQLAEFLWFVHAAIGSKYCTVFCVLNAAAAEAVAFISHVQHVMEG